MSLEVAILSNNDKIVLDAEKGDVLLRLLGENDFNITSPCGGSGSCGKCKVKVLEGNEDLTENERKLLSAQDIKEGYRLACQVKVVDDMLIEIAEEGAIDVVTEGMEYKINFHPQLKAYNIQQRSKDKEDYKSYLKFLYQSSSTNNIPFTLLQKLPDYIEEENVSLLTDVDYEKIISISKKAIDEVYGLAVDIGTTTVAVYLVNLLTGKEIDVDSFHNPQKKHGADVISRINYAQQGKENVKELQKLIVEKLNSSISRLSSRNGIDSDDIYLMTVVGNTTMTYLLMGVNPKSLAQAPYYPVFTNLQELKPSTLKININEGGMVEVLPAVSAYIGSDIMADLLVSDFDSDQWNLLIDIGTNGEIVLCNKQRMLTCSAAAGPVFEGAKITFGTAGVPGAVSSFKITDNNEIVYKTIDSKAPLGICGSGLIDIVSELLENNIIDRTGLFNENLQKSFPNKVTSYKDIKAFEIADSKCAAFDEAILLTQKDIRELQLAKGAIAAGINILLKEAGVSYEDLENIYLAGGFGSFIDPVNACRIGLLPNHLEKTITKIGNGAGLGAKIYLLDKSQKQKMNFLYKNIEYIELSFREDFQKEFMNSMEF